MLFDLISDKLEIKIYLQILQKAADADLINVRIVEIEGVESFPTQVDIDVMKSSQMLDDWLVGTLLVFSEELVEQILLKTDSFIVIPHQQSFY